MALGLDKLVKVLGKNADDFAKVGKSSSKAYQKALGDLTQEFNEVGAKAAKWADAGDFSKMSQAQQLDVVGKYRTHLDNMRSNAQGRQARIEELRNKAAQKHNPGHKVEGKLDGESPQQAYKRQQSEKRRQHAKTAEERAEQGMRGRSLEEHEAAVKAAKEPELEARREEVRQRILERRKTQAYDKRTGTNSAQREHYHNQRAKAMDEMSASDFRAHEEEQLGKVFEENLKAEEAARQARVDEVNSMKKKTLGEKAREVIEGTSDESKLVAGRKTRKANMDKANADIEAANQQYIETGVGSAQASHTKQSYWAEVKGKGKQTGGDTKLGQGGTTAPNGTNPADIAGENATNGFNFDGIADWAKENQLIVAGGLVAGTLLLTDD